MSFQKGTKPRPTVKPLLIRRLSLQGSPALLAATSLLYGCVDHGSGPASRSESYTQRDLRTINPRRYFETLTPGERERELALMDRNRSRR